MGYTVYITHGDWCAGLLLLCNSLVDWSLCVYDFPHTLHYSYWQFMFGPRARKSNHGMYAYMTSSHNKLQCWGTHTYVSNLTIIGSDNGLSPGRHQAIIWTNDGILLFGPLGTNFSEVLIGIQTFSFKKMHLKMSSAKWRPFGYVFPLSVHFIMYVFCYPSAHMLCWFILGNVIIFTHGSIHRLPLLDAVYPAVEPNVLCNVTLPMYFNG